jgi:hypothetical protein
MPRAQRTTNADRARPGINAPEEAAAEAQPEATTTEGAPEAAAPGNQAAMVDAPVVATTEPAPTEPAVQPEPAVEPTEPAAQPEPAVEPTEPVAQAEPAAQAEGQAAEPAVEDEMPTLGAVASAPPPPVGGGRLRRFLGRLLRAIVLVAVAAAVAVGIYLGWPIVYDRYLAPVQTNSADVGTLRDQVADLQHQIDALKEADAAVDGRLGSIDQQLADHDRMLASLDAMDTTLAAADTATGAEMVRQVHILKGMELMSRARLFLYESNFGLAAQDLGAARDLLADLGSGGSVDDRAAVTAAVDRLNRALSSLPDFPVVAAGDLDIAWQALLGRVPAPIATSVPTVEPSAGAEPSAEPGATAEPGSSTAP